MRLQVVSGYLRHFARLQTAAAPWSARSAVGGHERLWLVTTCAVRAVPLEETVVLRLAQRGEESRLCNSLLPEDLSGGLGSSPNGLAHALLVSVSHLVPAQLAATLSPARRTPAARWLSRAPAQERGRSSILGGRLQRWQIEPGGVCACLPPGERRVIEQRVPPGACQELGGNRSVAHRSQHRASGARPVPRHATSSAR